MQGLVTVFGGTGFVGAQVVRALFLDGAAHPKAEESKSEIKSPRQTTKIEIEIPVGKRMPSTPEERKQRIIDACREGIARQMKKPVLL